MKPGCNASEHTIVYLKPGQPYYIPGEYERGMTKDPIAIEATDPNEEMRPKSRLRFGKAVSIECNVKVRDIGMVAAEHRSKLLYYFQTEQDIGFEPDEDDSDATAEPEIPRTGPASTAYGSNTAYQYYQSAQYQ